MSGVSSVKLKGADDVVMEDGEGLFVKWMENRRSMWSDHFMSFGKTVWSIDTIKVKNLWCLFKGTEKGLVPGVVYFWVNKVVLGLCWEG